MFPGVALVEVKVIIPDMDVLEGPHVVRQSWLPLDEGVVGEPHAVIVIALSPRLQTFDE